MPGGGVSSYANYTYLGGTTGTSLPVTERAAVLSAFMPDACLHFSKLSSDHIDMVIFLLTGQLPDLKLARAGITDRNAGRWRGTLAWNRWRGTQVKERLV
jgi:hypothetical protein